MNNRYYWIADNHILEIVNQIPFKEELRLLKSRYLKGNQLPFKEYQGLFTSDGEVVKMSASKGKATFISSAQKVIKEASKSLHYLIDLTEFGKQPSLNRALHHLQWNWLLQNQCPDPTVGGTLFLLEADKALASPEQQGIYDLAIATLSQKGDLRLRKKTINILMELLETERDRLSLTHEKIGYLCYAFNGSYRLEIHRRYTTGGSKLVMIEAVFPSPSLAIKYAKLLIQQGKISCCWNQF